jgi:hypothetical protein
MTLGTGDRKKVIALGVLMLGASYAFYDNVLSTPSVGPSTPPAGAVTQRNGDLEVASAPVTPTAPAPKSTQPRPLLNRSTKNDEFHPVLRPKGRMGEVQVDPNSIDPTIHMEILAKIQDTKLEGGQRNLFQFGAAPAPEPLKGKEPVVQVVRVYDYPREAPKPAPPPLPPPPPPPTPPSFKYYGLATKRIDNKRTAFFLDGEDIILATEGMTVKGRWKVLKIGSDSVTLEDAQTKRQQPLAISEEAGGNGNS